MDTQNQHQDLNFDLLRVTKKTIYKHEFYYFYNEKFFINFYDFNILTDRRHK